MGARSALLSRHPVKATFLGPPSSSLAVVPFAHAACQDQEPPADPATTLDDAGEGVSRAAAYEQALRAGAWGWRLC